MSEISGRLILLPMPLGPEQAPDEVLPESTRRHFGELDTYIVENAKAARSFLKPLIGDRAIQSLTLIEWNKQHRHDRPQELLKPLRDGIDIGLLSDAGCPAVADPGADLVAAAHAMGARVIPAIGPSSLLLALMASGMGGQAFAFRGYLPAKPPAREQALREIEQRSAQTGETILFIETPYRNPAVLDSAVRILAPGTLLMLAAGLSLDSEHIVSRPVEQWRHRLASARVDARTPAVFGIKAQPSAVRARPVLAEQSAKYRRSLPNAAQRSRLSRKDRT